MRFVLAVVVAAALAWCGWWWFSASYRERALEGWLAERRADGWVAEAAAISTGGFPTRVDVRVDSLSLADPEAGWSWHADAFEILSAAHRPQEFTVVWPAENVIVTPYETFRVGGETLDATLAFEPNARLALDGARLAARDLAVTGESGWSAGIDAATLTSRQAPDFAHVVTLDARGITLPDLLGENITDGALPRSIDGLRVEATLDFDRPWDRAAVDAGGARLEALDLADMTVTWGDLDLRGTGRLRAGADGLAEGKIDLVARNWQGMLDVAEASGAVAPGIIQTLRAGLSVLTAFTGNRDELRVALDFRDGATRLGPIPLGPAPRLAGAQ